MVGFFQRIKQEKVGSWIFEEHHLPVLERFTWASELGMVFQRFSRLS